MFSRFSGHKRRNSLKDVDIMEVGVKRTSPRILKHAISIRWLAKSCQG